MYKDLVEKSAATLAAQDDAFFKNTFRRDELVNSAIDTVRHFERDMQRLKQDAGVLFASAGTAGGGDNGAKMAELFDKWRDNPPSTVAIICAAAEHFDIPPDNRHLKAAIMAGLAAEVDNDNPYHSNHHFREVTATMARLCNVNNELAASGKPGAIMLESDNVAKCLLAAAGHDLMHDGKTNSLTGPESHQQYRLENKAIGAIEPFMQVAGMSARDQEDVRVMIRITDISAPPGGKSPHSLLKGVFKEPPVREQSLSSSSIVQQYLKDHNAPVLVDDSGKALPSASVELPPALRNLAQDQTLLTMCTLMSDADLGPSTATNFEYSRKMTTLLSRENPALADSNKTLSGFLQFVVGGELTSDAGKTASQKALSSIMQEAQKPDGNAPTPAMPAAKQTAKSATPQ